MIVDTRDGRIVTARAMMGANPLTCPTIPFQLYEGYTDLADVPAPDHDPLTHRVERAAYAVRDGDSWVPQYNVIALTQAEIDAARRALVPAEVPRWAGRLALKRHVAQEGVLVLLEPSETSSDNLLALVLLWRDSLLPGELRDRVDAALDDAKDWLRDSDTVATLAAVLGLTDDQIDALFIWAGQQRV